ncbi:hypothetical protein TIFTF001_019716 [Ficus carica]|uniref:Uncharacterized protein n=1 Tax=Ficus carica TaxID=3494 RepID=A0AA88AEU3_FICCA|nr:hypothetical protein TIFTF001_019716 [Ficus carica]
MEISLDAMKPTQQVTNKKGGLRTMPFIIANEVFEKVAGIGLHANMMVYLRMEYHLDVATGVGQYFAHVGSRRQLYAHHRSFPSDSHLGRFRVIALGTVTTLFGMIVSWITAIIPQARPPHCGHRKDVENCVHADSAQLLLLISSFVVMDIGAGGIRPCSMAFGADQLNDSKNLRVSVNKNLFAGFGHVISAAWKNRHLSLPPEDFDGWHYLKGSKLVKPTNKLRFLNKACMIRNPEKDLTPEGLASNPWNLCTVKQVEELKALLKVLPIWSTSIFIAATLSQHSLSLIQANTTNRHLTSRFQIPAGSFVVFAILTLILWVALYDRAIVPILSRHTKRPRGLTYKQRMGIGLAIACIATSVAAIVETKRRNRGNRGKAMSAVWLVPQYCLTGLAEAFSAIGQIEFYYSQLPKNMASVAMALFTLGMGLGNLVGAVIVRLVNRVSGQNGRVKWLTNNPNNGHYDYYYWLLSFLGVVNFLYFVLCSWFYGSCEEKKIWNNDEGEGLVELGDHHLGKSKEASKEEEGKEEEDLGKSKEYESSSIVFAA